MRTKENLSISKTRLLETCAEIEDNVARLYHLFSEQAGDDTAFRKLWRQTALEEEEHANQFRLGGRLRGEAIEDIVVDEDRTIKVLAAVKAVLVRAQETPLSCEHALRLSIQIEEKLAEFHMGSVAVFCDEQCAKLFKSMMVGDKAHLERLKQAYDQIMVEKL